MSHCSHEEAVSIFIAATEPIVVEVTRRTSSTTVNNAPHSDDNNQQEKDEKLIYQPPSSVSREVQTEVGYMENICLSCGDYGVGYNTTRSEENLIFPDFEYEVIIPKYEYSSVAFKIIMVRILQTEEIID